MPKSNSGDSSSKRASKVDPLRLLVGVESDAEIARRAGVVPETVRIYRIRHGIPSAREASGPNPSSDAQSDEPAAEPAPKRAIPQPAYPELTAETPKPRRAGVASPIDPYAHLLGTMPDTVLAARIGVTRGAVYQYRRHRGIPAFGDEIQRTVSAEGATVAASAGRSGKGAFSFVVVAAQGSQQKSYAVIANDIIDATNKALAALPSGARVVSVTQHLELL
jgi:hypothetical protein